MQFRAPIYKQNVGELDRVQRRVTSLKNRMGSLSYKNKASKIGLFQLGTPLYLNIRNNGMSTVVLNSLRTLGCLPFNPSELSVLVFLRWLGTSFWVTIGLRKFEFDGHKSLQQ